MEGGLHRERATTACQAHRSFVSEIQISQFCEPHGCSYFLYDSTRQVIDELSRALVSGHADRAKRAARGLTLTLQDFPALHWYARELIVHCLREIPHHVRNHHAPKGLLHALAEVIIVLSVTTSDAQLILSEFSSVSSVLAILSAVVHYDTSLAMQPNQTKLNVKVFVKSALQNLLLLRQQQNTACAHVGRIEAEVNRLLSPPHIVKRYDLRSEMLRNVFPKQHLAVSKFKPIGHADLGNYARIKLTSKRDKILSIIKRPTLNITSRSCISEEISGHISTFKSHKNGRRVTLHKATPHKCFSAAMGRIWLLTYSRDPLRFVRSIDRLTHVDALPYRLELANEVRNELQFAKLRALLISDAMDNGLIPTTCSRKLQPILAMFSLPRRDSKSTVHGTTTNGSVPIPAASDNRIRQQKYGFLGYLTEHSVDALAIMMEVRRYLSSDCRIDHNSFKNDSLSVPDTRQLTESLTVAYILFENVLGGCLYQYIACMHSPTLQRTMTTLMTRYRIQAANVRAAVKLIGSYCRTHLCTRFPWTAIVNDSVLSRLYLYNDISRATAEDAVPDDPVETPLGALALHTLSYRRTQALITAQLNSASNVANSKSDKHDLERAICLLAHRISWLLSKQDDVVRPSTTFQKWLLLFSSLKAACLSTDNRQYHSLQVITPYFKSTLGPSCDINMEFWPILHCAETPNDMHDLIPYSELHVTLWASWEVQKSTISSNRQGPCSRAKFADCCESIINLPRGEKHTDLSPADTCENLMRGIMLGAFRGKAQLFDYFGQETQHVTVPEWLTQLFENLTSTMNAEDGFWIIRSVRWFLESIPILLGKPQSERLEYFMSDETSAFGSRNIVIHTLNLVFDSCVPDECIRCARKYTSTLENDIFEKLSCTEKALALLMPAIQDMEQQGRHLSKLARISSRWCVIARASYSSVNTFYENYPRSFLLSQYWSTEHRCSISADRAADSRDPKQYYDFQACQRRILQLLGQPESQDAIKVSGNFH